MATNKIARRRPVVSGDGASPGGGATRLELSRCYLCNGELEPFEPFQLVLVLDAERQLVNLAYHQACELDAIATAMGDEIEAVQEGGRAESIGDRLRDLVEDLMERLDGAR